MAPLTGHSLANWFKLKHSGIDLRQVPQLRTYSPIEVSLHNQEHDCWIIVHQKIYNITPFLDYHPGGRDILLKYAGQDATHAFRKFFSVVDRILVSLMTYCPILILILSIIISRTLVEHYHNWVNAERILDACLVGFNKSPI